MPAAATAPAAAPSAFAAYPAGVPVAGQYRMMMPNGQFVPTAATPPAPAWPDTSARGYTMQPPPEQPADSKKDRKRTEAKEGRPSWTFGP